MSAGDESPPLSDDGWEPDRDDEDWDEDGDTFGSAAAEPGPELFEAGSCRVIRALTRRI